MSEGTLRGLFQIVIGLTAVSTLSFPILFSRYNWKRSAIGRALMVKSSSTALAANVAFVTTLWRPPVEVRFVIYILAFGAIGISSARLTRTMVKINNADRVVQPKKKDEGSK